MKPRSYPDQEIFPTIPREMPKLPEMFVGTRVRRKYYPGRILTITAVENQIGSDGKVKRKKCIIRLDDGSVETPENLEVM